MEIKRNYYLKILVVSYLVVLVIPLVTGNLGYFLSKKIMEEEVFRSNSAILKQACSYIDNQLSQVKLLATDIELNPRINEFINVRNADTGTNQYKIYNIVKDMSIYKNKYPFISDFYIFYKNSDKIITSSSVCSSGLFYEYIWGYKKWEHAVSNDQRANTYSIVQQATEQQPDTRYIAFVRPLPIYLSHDTGASLVILVEEQKVQSLLGDLKWLNNGLLYIADNDGRLITTNGSNITVEDFSKIRLDGDEGYTVLDTNEGSMALSYISSQQHGWKYVSLMPMNIYMGRVSSIRKVTSLIFAISLIIGLVAVVLLAYKNYSPVRKILGMLPIAHSGTGKPAKKINEFDYIQKTITHTFEEDRRILELLNEQKPIIRDNMLQRLLEGKIDLLQPSFKKSIGSFGIEFPYDLYTVAVFNLDKQQILMEGYTEEQWELSKLKVSSCLTKIFSDKDLKTYVTDIETENLILIINIASSNVDNTMERLNTLSEKALCCIKDMAELYCTVGIGSIYKSVTGINKAYMEAIRSLDYRMLRKYGSIIRYNDIVESDQSFYFPIETEQQMINYIKAGELASAKKTFDYVFDENVNKRHLSPEMLRLLFSDIVGTVAKIIINEIKIDYKSVFREDFNPATCFSDCVTTEDIKNRFYTIFNNLCNFINNNKKSHNTLLLNKITNYVKTEYTNPELCLQLIASVFGISIPYLSRFFKEQTGENLNSYINNMRIAKAKELLQHDNVTISDVAKNVGFNNDSSFIRVFKKNTGKTPGAYKLS